MLIWVPEYDVVHELISTIEFLYDWLPFSKNIRKASSSNSVFKCRSLTVPYEISLFHGFHP